MKLPAICALALSATVASSMAGSFGGPPPFTNLSPLQSGIDGSYQAVCRGLNLTGVMRFTYSSGNQSSNPTQNTYNFFVDGKVVNGGLTAAINDKDVTGILEGPSITVPTNADGQIELPLVFIVSGSRASGAFQGQIDLEDRMSSFSGDGEVASAAPETNTVIFIPDITDFIDIDFGDNNQDSEQNFIFTNQFIIPGSDIPPTEFTFTGVRTSTSASAGTATFSATTATPQQ